MGADGRLWDDWRYKSMIGKVVCFNKRQTDKLDRPYAITLENDKELNQTLANDQRSSGRVFKKKKFKETYIMVKAVSEKDTTST